MQVRLLCRWHRPGNCLAFHGNDRRCRLQVRRLVKSFSSPNACLCHYNHHCGNDQSCWVKKIIMSSTPPVSNTSSPTRNAEVSEQSNKVREKVKIFRLWVFLQVLIHYTYISTSSLKIILLNKRKKTVQNKEVRRKRQNIQTMSILSTTNHFH